MRKWARHRQTRVFLTFPCKSRLDTSFPERDALTLAGQLRGRHPHPRVQAPGSNAIPPSPPPPMPAPIGCGRRVSIGSTAGRTLGWESGPASANPNASLRQQLARSCGRPIDGVFRRCLERKKTQPLGGGTANRASHCWKTSTSAARSLEPANKQTRLGSLRRRLKKIKRTPGGW